MSWNTFFAFYKIQPLKEWKYQIVCLLPRSKRYCSNKTKTVKLIQNWENTLISLFSSTAAEIWGQQHALAVFESLEPSAGGGRRARPAAAAVRAARAIGGRAAAAAARRAPGVRTKTWTWVWFRCRWLQPRRLRWWPPCLNARLIAYQLRCKWRLASS